MPNGIRYVLAVKEREIFSTPYLEEIDTMTSEYSLADFKMYLLEKEAITSLKDYITIRLYNGENFNRELPLLFKEDDYKEEEVFYAYQEYLYQNPEELKKLIQKITPGFKTNTFKTDRDKKNKAFYDKISATIEQPNIYFEIGVFLKGYLGNSYLKYRDVYFFLKRKGIKLVNSKGKSRNK